MKYTRKKTTFNVQYIAVYMILLANYKEKSSQVFLKYEKIEFLIIFEKTAYMTNKLLLREYHGKQNLEDNNI